MCYLLQGRFKDVSRTKSTATEATQWSADVTGNDTPARSI